MKSTPQQVFTGESASLDYLNPDNTPFTPLVEVPTALNPYRKDGVRIFAKLMSATPLANVKSLPAYHMLSTAEREGLLKGKDTIIENSSGNTVMSLTVIGRLMGIPHTKAIVSHLLTRGKLQLLRFFGTEVVVNKEPMAPDPHDTTNGIFKARHLAREHNWYNPAQYDNDANPEAHTKWTGPQLWDQTEGKLSLLSVGLGTTGTVVGLGRFFKKAGREVTIIGATQLPDSSVPGVRPKALLGQIDFDWEEYIDAHVEVDTTEAYRMSMQLCRHGLLVGPSAGLAFASLLSYLKINAGGLEGETTAVFICPDTPFPYIEEYFAVLPPEEFPPVENEHLLTNNN